MSDDDKALAAQASIVAITQARLTFGRRLAAQDTATVLTFALDHARAREAVTSDMDVVRLGAALRDAGLRHLIVQSAAATRDIFVQRPDLGRMLPHNQVAVLGQDVAPDVALVLGDGLSAVATILNGPAYMAALAPLLTQAGLSVSPVVLARQARVALGDGIARAMGARTVVMALGERPGLSAADGLGIYITHLPSDKTPDSARNCLSNVREKGLSVTSAARQTASLIARMRKLGCSGVTLNRQRTEPVVQDGTDPDE